MMAFDFARRLRAELLMEMFGRSFRMDLLPSSLEGEIGTLLQKRNQPEESIRERVAYIRGINRAIEILDETIKGEL